MARRKDTRTPAQRDQHQAIIAQRLLRGGKTQAEIADELGIDQSTVSRDIASLRKGWQKSASLDFAVHLAQALAARRDLLAEWWQGWQSSDKAADDSRFLAGASNEWDRIERLLGLGAPNKLLIPDVSDWTDDELNEYATTGKLPARTRRIGRAGASQAGTGEAAVKDI